MSAELVIAVDEAGYGPNLGPLVIAATAWHNADRLPLERWREALASGFNFEPGERSPRLAIGDSKRWFVRGRSHEPVRRTLDYFSRCVGPACEESDCFLDSLDKDFGKARAEAPWLCEHGVDRTDADKQAETITADLQTFYTQASDALDCCGLRLVAWQARIVGEAEFNHAVDRDGNKASVLSRLSLDLANHLIDRCNSSRRTAAIEPSSVRMIFDKHGGRNKYLPILLARWPDRYFEVQAESLPISRYRSAAPLPWDIEFTAKADRLPAVGLSSMLAKWVREALMRRLNRFWQQHCPDVAPTAGYPVDAKRFAAQIASQAESLGFVRRHWWRMV